MLALCCAISLAARNRPRRAHREHATPNILILLARSPSVTASLLIGALSATMSTDLEIFR
jgi:hypothetical protein